MNKTWRLFNGEGTGGHVHEFIKRYREKQVRKRTAKLKLQAYHVRQTLRRFPQLDMEALQAKYPEIDVQSQAKRLDEDHKIKRQISRYFTKP